MNSLEYKFPGLLTESTPSIQFEIVFFLRPSREIKILNSEFRIQNLLCSPSKIKKYFSPAWTGALVMPHEAFLSLKN